MGRILFIHQHIFSISLAYKGDHKTRNREIKKFRVWLILPYGESIRETKCWSQRELWGLLLKETQGLVSDAGHAKGGRSKAL